MGLYGIYCYMDCLNNNEVVYVGKDTNIDKDRRHSQHLQQSNYDKQVINRVLQDNPDRYYYKLLSIFNPRYSPSDLLNTLEILFIKHFKPKFNFTIGGDTTTGWKPSLETRQRISNSLKGFKHSEETKLKMSESKKGEKNTFYGKTHSEESKRKIGNANKGRTHSEEVLLKMSETRKGVKKSHGHKLNISKSQNTSGYFRVRKRHNPRYKNGVNYEYLYYDENGKRKSISSTDINKLESIVKSKGLEWIKYE